MSKKFLFVLTILILISSSLPAFGEVTQFQLDKESYTKEEYINLHGSVSEDSSGLVSIVIRDPNDRFILLSQAIVRGDSSFEKTIPITKDFEVLGKYNATAFVLNITEAKIQSFHITENFESIENTSLTNEENFFDVALTENKKNLESTLTYDTTITKSESMQKTTNHASEIADFVDQTRDPQYYLDRYYNEPNYKSWFDRNYPGLTIEKAVGYTIPEKTEKTEDIIKTEFIPKAEASSIVSAPKNQEDNSDLAHMGLAIGGLAILFGAVYGIKKKVDTNSKHISINKDIIRKKFLSPIIDSNPLGIIQTRLAKGEITMEEYDKLKEKLEKSR
ncbi:MAG: SHOCT domain-containing protein [Nitrosopumilaceae archaeon]|jgi:hypothetical protein